MGLYDQEIRELRKELKKLDDINLDHVEKLKLKLSIYAQTTKKGNLIISAIGMAQRQGKQFRREMMRTGLIGDSSVIDPDQEQVEVEKVLCEDQNKIISRKECLARSSNPDWFEQCRQCPVDKTTRRLLIHAL